MHMLATRPKIKKTDDGRRVKIEPYQPLFIPPAPAGPFEERELLQSRDGDGQADGRTEVVPLALGFLPLCKRTNGKWDVQLRISFADDEIRNWKKKSKTAAELRSRSSARAAATAATTNRRGQR